MTSPVTATDATYRELYLTAPCGLVTTTADGIITGANLTFLAWTGHELDAVVGTSLKDHLDAGGAHFFETRYSPMLRLQGQVEEVALTFRAADGSGLPALLNASPRGDGLEGLIFAVFSATARQQYERDMMVARRDAESSEGRVRILQEATSAFAASATEQDVCDALFGSAQDAFSPHATGVFLLDENGDYPLRAGTSPLEGLINPTQPRASDAALSEGRMITVFADDPDSQFPAAAGALAARGLRAVTVTPLLRGGVPLGVLGCFFVEEQNFDAQFINLQMALARQASQAIIRVRLTLELERLALYDQLTGLLNRKLLQEMVTDSIARAGSSGRPLAIIFLDLDGFKGVNDQLGHAAGDQVLIRVAERIRSGVRHGDAIGRYGGDEFVAICDDADFAAAGAIAERIRAAVGQPMEDIPERLAVTASVGIAIFTPGSTEPPTNDDLLSFADDAMYLSKSAGKNRVSYFGTES